MPTAFAVLLYCNKLLQDQRGLNAMSVRRLARCDLKLPLGKSTSFSCKIAASEKYADCRHWTSTNFSSRSPPRRSHQDIPGDAQPVPAPRSANPARWLHRLPLAMPIGVEPVRNGRPLSTRRRSRPNLAPQFGIAREPRARLRRRGVRGDRGPRSGSVIVSGHIITPLVRPL